MYITTMLLVRLRITTDWTCQFEAEFTIRSWISSFHRTNDILQGLPFAPRIEIKQLVFSNALVAGGQSLALPNLSILFPVRDGSKLGFLVINA